MSINRFILPLIILCCISTRLCGQTDYILDFSDNLSPSLESVLLKIEQQSPYSLSYSPNKISLNQIIYIQEVSLSVNEILEIISNQANLRFEINNSEKRIVLLPNSTFQVNAFIRDSLSGENIIGAIVLADHRFLATSNNNGYFNITLDFDNLEIDIYNIGYVEKSVTLNPFESDNLIIYLKPKLELNVVITPENTHVINANENIALSELNNHFGTAGGNDLIQNLKFIPGVSAGPEGQNGFAVRGGGPHQNLILIDDIPIYEASHLGGISSIFLPGSINSINFLKSAFPARYGGRLSSVLDVRLKDGNKNHYTRNISVGLEGLTGHLDGPLGNHTSININLRASWFSTFAEPLVKKFSDVEDLSLKYNDSYSKITHWFSGTSKLSLSAYWGDDLVKFQRDQTKDDQTGFKDFNRIAWGNRFLSLKWDKLLNDKWHLQANIGRTDYNYRSRGSFNRSFLSDSIIGNNAFDILSISEIRDHLINIELDHYTSKGGQYKFGIHYSNHKNNPSITESRIFGNVEETPIVTDTTYLTNEINVYAQNKISLSDNFSLTTGIRVSLFNSKNIKYIYPEPRVLLTYEDDNDQVKFSYSRMSQFIHLLSNPGPGLPSDLWVPSTSKVAPELSHIFSLDYYHERNNTTYGFSAWYKTFSNVIEYSIPSAIIYSLIINNELFQLEVDNLNWEERVSIGSAYATGFELFYGFKTAKLGVMTNYSYSRSIREFSNIDGGESFPYKYDSPHNFSSQVKFYFNPLKSLIINWQFSSGTAYSLFDTQRPGTNGEPVLVPSSRNNFRLPSFHHLDVHYRVEKPLKDDSKFIIDIGIYNIYNRLNAFYEYLSQDTQNGPAELIKISIYPILPQLNISYQW